MGFYEMSSQDTEGDEEVSAFFRNVQEIRAEEVLPTEIMDKLKKLEDSVENLKKLEHSMGLIFQQLKNLENSIASSAVPSAPQAIISAPMSSYAVPSASISSAVPSAPQAIISVASISSAVPSASISSAVPSASISPAVPSTSISSAVPSAPQAIISVASISSAVPSATVSTAVPPATVSTAVPPGNVFSILMQFFRIYAVLCVLKPKHYFFHVCMQLHNCLIYVFVYILFYLFLQ
ncbi:uncharacterized protein LOC124819055 [Hydra vulgaris]|uniref:uncharacterized protein LOC124819055 n=1 Tax=Hydra vulgaris TaxID=6087 RepID=UPI0032EA62E8